MYSALREWSFSFIVVDYLTVNGSEMQQLVTSVWAYFVEPLGFAIRIYVFRDISVAVVIVTA